MPFAKASCAKTALALALPLLAQQPSGDEILRQMAQTYSALQAVHIVATRSDEIQFAGAGPVTTQTSYVFAARGQGRVRVIQKSEHEEAWLIGNGEATWKALGREKKWARMNTATVDTGEDEADAAKPMDFRSAAQSFLLSRAIAFGRRVEGSSAVKQDQYKLDGGERVPCHIVTFTVGEARHELWVDQQRHFVLQWIQTVTARAGDRVVKTRIAMKVKKFATGAEVEDNLFAFTPPKDWKETEMVVFASESRLILTGQRAAAFTLKTLEGDEVSLAGLRGKVVVMDFWATWCPPCRDELPRLEKLSKELAARGIVFVGVNNEEASTARGFVRKQGYEIPVLMDSKREVNRRYGISAIPSLFVIDRDGVIRRHFIGSRGEEALRKAIVEVAEGKGG